MLVWLAELLAHKFTGFNVFSYLTFRAIVGLLTALVIALWMGPRLIAFLQKMQIGQVVRSEGPESHFSKRGTPTMGDINSVLDYGLRITVGKIRKPLYLVRVICPGGLRDCRLCG